MRAKLQNFVLKRDGAIAVQLLTKIKPMELHGKVRHFEGEEDQDKAVQLTFWEPNFVLHGVTLGDYHIFAFLVDMEGETRDCRDLSLRRRQCL